MMAAPACSRTGLFVGVGGSSGVRSDAGPGDAAPPTCADDAGVGKLARTSGPQQSAANAAVIDPNDDVLVVLGGTSSSGVYAKAISTVSLATGETQTLSRSGDSRVDLGPNGRALWDAVHDRGIVLGLGLSPWESNPPRDDKRQVFAVRLQGNSAHLALLPDFPEGQTSDIALAAAIDPVTDRLYAIPGKGSVPGPVHTWALRLAPGQESWSMFDNDSQAALQKVQLLSLSLDPVGRRLLAVGSEIYPGKQRSLWALSLDAPSGWTRIPGTFPPDSLVVRPHARRRLPAELGSRAVRLHHRGDRQRLSVRRVASGHRLVVRRHAARRGRAARGALRAGRGGVRRAPP